MPRRRLAALLAVTLLVPAGVLVYALSTRGKSATASTTATPTSIFPAYDARRAVVGKPVPDFTLTSTTGSRVEFARYRGMPVLLTFFASWCHPCEAELPVLQKLSREYEGRLAIVAVNYQDIATDSRAFVTRLGVTFPALIENEAFNPVAVRFGVHEIPITFFVDAHGVLASTPVFGQTDRASLQPGIDTLFGR